uniref:U31-Eretoxin-Ek1i_2 n=1 Tax=Eresus cinnaberinus TaxID=175337 RepID=A0A2D0PC69_ERECI
MNTFWVLIVVSALAVVSCDDGTKDPELAAVQKKLQMFELLQKFLAAIYASGTKTEQREDCLDIGEECFMVAGPNCCGFSNWCNYEDECFPGDANNPPRCVNRCRPGSLTRWLEKNYNETIGRK